jgi:hypothetical protein
MDTAIDYWALLFHFVMLPNPPDKCLSKPLEQMKTTFTHILSKLPFTQPSYESMLHNLLSRKASLYKPRITQPRQKNEKLQSQNRPSQLFVKHVVPHFCCYVYRCDDDVMCPSLGGGGGGGALKSPKYSPGLAYRTSGYSAKVKDK